MIVARRKMSDRYTPPSAELGPRTGPVLEVGRVLWHASVLYALGLGSAVVLRATLGTPASWFALFVPSWPGLLFGFAYMSSRRRAGRLPAIHPTLVIGLLWGALFTGMWLANGRPMLRMAFTQAHYLVVPWVLGWYFAVLWRAKATKPS